MSVGSGATAGPNRLRSMAMRGAMVVGIALVLAQVALLAWHPASGGAIGMWGGSGEPCAGDGSSDCYRVDYAAGRSAGILLSLHNDAPLAMTIEGVRPIQAECAECASPLLPMQASVPASLDLPPLASRALPLDVGPGADGVLLYSGQIASCEALGVTRDQEGWTTIDSVEVSIRWGLAPATFTMPLQEAMEVHAPKPGDCP